MRVTKPLAPDTVAPDFTLPLTPRAHTAPRRPRGGPPAVLVLSTTGRGPVERERLALYRDDAGDFGRCGHACSGHPSTKHGAIRNAAAVAWHAAQFRFLLLPGARGRDAARRRLPGRAREVVRT